MDNNENKKEVYTKEELEELFNTMNEQTKTHVRLKYNDKEITTDTGYALEGIQFFLECLGIEVEW